MRPCLFCSVCQNDLFDLSNYNPIDFPFHENTDAEYFQACDRAEIRVVVTQAFHHRIKLLLRYDKRSDGAHGRALSGPIAELGLRSGDRLDPNDNLQDVSAFDDVTGFPVNVVFWRPELATTALHRNPLFDETIGITPYRCFTVDSLHTMNLGLFQSWCKVAAWFLFDEGVYAPHAHTAEEQVQISILCMRESIGSFYLERKSSHGDEALTPVHDLTVKMFGTRSHPKLKLSGAETWGFLLFLVREFSRFGTKLSAKAIRLKRAGELLSKLQTAMSRATVNISTSEQQDSADSLIEFARLAKGLDGILIPKVHLAMHLIHRIPFQGPPRYYAIGLTRV